MSTLTILEQARKLLSDSIHWIQKAEAKDQLGRETDPYDPYAFSWCAIGALKRAAGYNYNNYVDATIICNDIAEKRLRAVDIHALNQSLIIYNDHIEVNHDDILSLFDEAIEKAKL